MRSEDSMALPPGWTSAAIEELASNDRNAITDGPFGSNLKTEHYTDAGPRVIRLQNIGDCVFVDAKAHITQEHYERLSKHHVFAGDIVIAGLGQTLPRSCIVPPSVGPAIVKADCIRFKPDERVALPSFLNYAINSEQIRRRTAQIIHGVGRPRLNVQEIKSIVLPVAPLPEQRRIVAAIETQLTRLDAAVAALERARANLKRYRAAVLKAACEGRLVPTEAELARAEGRGYEPASVLLERIGAETDGVSGEGVPILSEGWSWSRFDQIMTYLRNGISTKPDASEGTPILRISAVRPMQVDFEDIRFLSAQVSVYQDYVLQSGDLLFTRYNGSPHLVGVCAAVKSMPRTTVHPDKLIRAQVNRDTVLPDYLQIVLNAGASRDFIGRRIRTTAGQSGISGRDIRGIPVPVPPLAEQRRIVAEVERRLSVVEEMEGAIGANLRRAERVRQGVLRRAFAGELVAQDPTDEPASVLLERIRAGRAAQKKQPAIKRTRAVDQPKLL